MKLKCLLIFIFSVIFSNNIISCNINIDSLFNSHISSMDKYFKSVIDGRRFPIDRMLSHINEKPSDMNYNDSSKMGIYGDNALFLEIFEDITNYKWERTSYAPNILASHQEILMIRDWYEDNRKRLNCEKIEAIYLWYRDRNKYMESVDLYDNESFENYYKKLDNLKALNTFIDIE